MAPRTLKRIHPALRDDIRDLQTRRPVPGSNLEQIDPFLFLNHHGPQVYPPGNDGLPFGPHPHRGFETVTFILEGDLAHRDSGGHESVIQAGGVQWMTAGRGLEHEELSSAAFKRSGGKLEILQLWLNLPARLKMTDPRYIGLQRDQIPSVQFDEGRATVNVISSELNGVKGPIHANTDVFMSTVWLAPGSHVRLPAPASRNVFLYAVRGSVRVGDQPLRAFELAELNGDGDEVDLSADENAVLLFGHATPYGEPVVSYGPFVMNTREEIVQAVRDYQSGKFGAALS